MRKDLRRWFRTVLTGAVICLVSLDSAVACRWRTRKSAACGAPTVCCSPAAACGCEGSSDGQSMSPIQKGQAAADDLEDATPPLPEAEADSHVPPQPLPSPPEAATPVPTTPVPETPAPATPAMPPAPPQRDNFDNLFPPATPAPTSPAAPATPPAPAPAPATDEDDPFAPPPAATRPPTGAAAEPATVDDDPFAPLPAKPTTAPVGASPSPTLVAPKPAADPLADPFSISSPAELPVREWIDDSGHFRVRGRLIAVLDGQIRILKETGRTTTVGWTRLSTADQTYVQEQLTRYGADLAEQFVAR
ncbi:MAG: SHD1 domain-containing protein [Pirellulaceae bacterium]